jgi:hypothetical protein
MQVEKISFDGRDYALVLRKGLTIEESTFFTDAENSLQLGIIKHERGYSEKPHTHRELEVCASVQQVLYVTKGVVAIDFFDNSGRKLGETKLNKGDTPLIMARGHGIRVLEDLECLAVKQGPYAGIEEDKINLI